jgi:hypothetical protein
MMKLNEIHGEALPDDDEFGEKCSVCNRELYIDYLGSNWITCVECRTNICMMRHAGCHGSGSPGATSITDVGAGWGDWDGRKVVLWSGWIAEAYDWYGDNPTWKALCPSCAEGENV